MAVINGSAPKPRRRRLKVAIAAIFVLIISLSLFLAISQGNTNKTGNTETQNQTPAQSQPQSQPQTQNQTQTASLKVEWQQYLPGIKGEYVIQTSDGGFLVLGVNASVNPELQMFENTSSIVVKTDSSGNIVWVKNYSITPEIIASAIDKVVEASDGYVFLGTFSPSNLFIFKTSFDGDLIWKQTYSKGVYEFYGADELIASRDGGYAILGDISYIFYYPWILKVDSTGNLQWNKTINMNISNIEDYGGIFVPWISGSPCAFLQTNDNGYVVLCTVGGRGTAPSSGELVKTNSEGNLQWRKLYGGEGDYPRFAACSMASTDDGFLIACLNGTRDNCIIKTDFEGNALWNKTYTYNSLPICVSSVSSKNGGGFVMLGKMFSDATMESYTWVAVADKDGNLLAQTVIEMNVHNAEPKNIVQTSDDGYAFVGVWNEDFMPSYDQKMWLVKLAPLS
jgi:hypothetical protein